MSEISRVTDHLTCIGASAMELGAFTVFLYMIKAREYLYELIEMSRALGSRFPTRVSAASKAICPKVLR